MGGLKAKLYSVFKPGIKILTLHGLADDFGNNIQNTASPLFFFFFSVLL